MSLETIKSLVTIAAVIGGAIWALYTFYVLQQRREAEAKITQMELQTENFPLNIQIATSLARFGDSRVLTVNAALSNPGAGPLTLRFDGPAFRLARVHPGQPMVQVANGSPLFFSSDQAEAVQQRILLAKQERHMPYAFFIAEPGLYLVQVSVTYADEARPARATLAFEQAIVVIE